MINKWMKDTVGHVVCIYTLTICSCWDFQTFCLSILAVVGYVCVMLMKR